MLNWYQHIPLAIDPIVFSIGSFALRWYAVSYLVGLLVIYGLLRLRIYREEFSVSIFNSQFSILPGQAGNKISNFKFQISNLVLDFLLISFIAAIIGGRLGFVLFYDLSYFMAHPWAIISPFDQAGGALIGIYGMSYFGALVGVVLASFYFCRKNKIVFWKWMDFVVPAIPAGYFFGRIGNFLNGELFGRVTSSPMGMYFWQDTTSLRHPSQLYEALGEGLLLFFILWSLRNKKYATGTISMLYIFGYGFVRFLVEFFRSPDPQLGLFWNMLSLGQLFSFAMMAAALLFWYAFRKRGRMV